MDILVVTLPGNKLWLLDNYQHVHICTHIHVHMHNHYVHSGGGGNIACTCTCIICVRGVLMTSSCIVILCMYSGFQASLVSINLTLVDYILMVNGKLFKNNHCECSFTKTAHP